MKDHPPPNKKITCYFLEQSILTLHIQCEQVRL